MILHALADVAHTYRLRQMSPTPSVGTGSLGSTRPHQSVPTLTGGAPLKACPLGAPGVNVVRVCSSRSFLSNTPTSLASCVAGHMLGLTPQSRLHHGPTSVLPLQSIRVVQGTCSSHRTCTHIHTHTHRCTTCAHVHTGLAWASPQVTVASATVRNERLRSGGGKVGRAKGPGLIHPGPASPTGQQLSGKQPPHHTGPWETEGTGARKSDPTGQVLC